MPSRQIAITSTRTSSLLTHSNTYHSKVVVNMCLTYLYWIDASDTLTIDFRIPNSNYVFSIPKKRSWLPTAYDLGLDFAQERDVSMAIFYDNLIPSPMVDP